MFLVGKKKYGTLGNPTAVDTDGLLVDVDVQSLTIHLLEKIKGKMSINSFIWLLSKM